MAKNTTRYDAKMQRAFDGAIREQWGYHDALADMASGNVPPWRRGPRDVHFDKAYVRGYYAGMDAAKLATQEDLRPLCGNCNPRFDHDRFVDAARTR